MVAGFTAPPFRVARRVGRITKVLQSPESGLSPSGVRPWEISTLRRSMKTMFERVSADDLMSLASRRHPPPLQVGAVLILDVRGGLDISSLRTVLQQRIAAVPPLLRQSSGDHHDL